MPKRNGDRTALMAASWNDEREIVQALLDKGAEINARANDGETALMIASGSGNHEVVLVLLDKGAADQRQDG